MSKNHLQIDGIKNELAGSSLFFVSPPDSPTLAAIPDELPSKPATTPAAPHEIQNVSNGNGLSEHATMKAIKHASQKASTNSGEHATNYDYIKAIRKTVRRVGKETLYLRITTEEKQVLQSFVHKVNEFNRREGFTTSENEISRIAINFLFEDHQMNGPTSILARTLAALQA